VKHIINGKKASSNDEVMEFLSSLIKEGDTLLDLGCGPKLYSTPFNDRCKKILTVDAWESVNPDIVADLEKEDLISVVNNEKFDYILMLDFIEHIEKSAGIRLIEAAKKITNKKIILLTPLEEIWDSNHKNVNDPSLWCYGNSFDLHKSVWAKNDFVDLGWNSVNLTGLEKYFIGTFSND
jgi:2-polyprenyl-3-methyl-5-hydroxy-6-metoxy-1,4-benzoquinol methylase